MASDAPLEEAKEFHKGFADGVKSEVHWDEADLVMTPLPIYFIMILCWPVVRKLPSTFALHKWLCVVLGTRQVGEYERVKKICQRFGIHLRRPGRPRKK